MSREEAIRAKTLELVNRTVEGERPARPKSGNGESGPLASQAEPVPAPEEPPEKPSSWWQQFVSGGKLIPRANATEALQLVLAELRMSVEARALEFPTDVVQASFYKALEKATGSDLGWRTMIEIYERQRIRERLRADH